jgi:RHS repeat-associated protein
MLSTDYYPFGMAMAENSYENVLETENKFKFQGQEHQDDFDLNWYQFKWRMHDPAIGRFMTIDPLAEDYVHNSPYAFAENKVITFVELEGLEGVHYMDKDGVQVIEKNVVVLTKPTSSDNSPNKNKRIERNNNARVSSVKNDLETYYNNNGKGISDFDGNKVRFKFNVSSQSDFNKNGMNKDQVDAKYRQIAKENGIKGSVTAPDGKTIDLIAPAAVLTREGSGGNLGETILNIMRVNSGSPEGTVSHEVLHSLGLPDNGYNKGGLLNSPPQIINSREVNDALKYSYKKKDEN